ncbi:hypothetical protein TRSC58_04448 [Trypanosoma rangeli SC58]|uniref:Uncharacterized protein n=1 Tax=Trypanosoma rangeli SC58 TaxID=429131 RepID=A0A061IYV3_TRYRA|nr:hypothetical protein TRSC58_04448 [Trypanosoma rangeli SC58]
MFFLGFWFLVLSGGEGEVRDLQDWRMRPWHLWCVLHSGIAGERHASGATRALPVHMIGVVHRLFPARGCGFVLAAPPPTSLAQTLWPLLSLMATESAQTADAVQQQELLSQDGPLSVCFSLPKDGVSTAKTREKCERVAPSSLQLSPGSYVKVSATCHYETAKQRVLWRTGGGGVTQCDPEEELRESLQKVRDVRWDRIILEDVKRETSQIPRQYALEEQVTVESAFFKRAVTDAETFRGLLLEEAAADDVGVEELQMCLAQERVRRIFDFLNKAAQRYVIREADLWRPLLSMRKDVGTQANAGGGGFALGAYQLAADERKRWEYVLRRLKEHD